LAAASLGAQGGPGVFIADPFDESLAAMPVAPFVPPARGAPPAAGQGAAPAAGQAPALPPVHNARLLVHGRGEG
jgi:hypothetical protein